MKIIAFYLPQFHTFPENDKWWGKGFTEWKSVKAAEVIGTGQRQPRIPLNQNYYDLTDNKVFEWQIKAAKEYGVYGFCFYHYWFSGKLLMEKPLENFLKDPALQIPFCLCWANHTWTRTWAAKEKEILIEQKYGDQDEWEAHFQYLLNFFSDKRYIKVEGKPLLVIYTPENIPDLDSMLRYWNKRAKENNLSGICFAYQFTNYNHLTDPAGDLFDYGIEYQPMYSRKKYELSLPFMIKKAKNLLCDRIGFLSGFSHPITFDYDREWENIIHTYPRDSKMLPGAFVDWDNTPRRKNRGTYYKNVTPDKFYKYLSRQIKHVVTVYKKDMLFMFAWNEWGEGGYLEPDSEYGYGMLEAIKKALLENGEFPQYPVEE